MQFPGSNFYQCCGNFTWNAGRFLVKITFNYTILSCMWYWTMFKLSHPDMKLEPCQPADIFSSWDRNIMQPNDFCHICKHFSYWLWVGRVSDNIENTKDAIIRYDLLKNDHELCPLTTILSPDQTALSSSSTNVMSTYGQHPLTSFINSHSAQHLSSIMQAHDISEMTVASDHFDWKACKPEITIHDIFNVMLDSRRFLWM